MHVMFNERLDMSSLDSVRTKGYGNQETLLVRTLSEREIEADLVVSVVRREYVKLSFTSSSCPIITSLRS